LEGKGLDSNKKVFAADFATIANAIRKVLENFFSVFRVFDKEMKVFLKKNEI